MRGGDLPLSGADWMPISLRPHDATRTVFPLKTVQLHDAHRTVCLLKTALVVGGDRAASTTTVPGERGTATLTARSPLLWDAAAAPAGSIPWSGGAAEDTSGRRPPARRGLGDAAFVRLRCRSGRRRARVSAVASPGAGDGMPSVTDQRREDHDTALVRVSVLRRRSAHVPRAGLPARLPTLSAFGALPEHPARRASRGGGHRVLRARSDGTHRP